MKNNRNLLYPIPISEVDESKLVNRISKILGHDIDRIDLQVAAEHKGILNAYWECIKNEPLKIDEEEVNLATIAAFLTQCPESLSFAFRHAHGIQRFNITETGKKNKPNIDYAFEVTDFEFYENGILMFGNAKNKETGAENEYLVYFDIVCLEFYKSNIQTRKLLNQVHFNLSEIENKRLSTIIKYAYKYMKSSDEVRLSKVTEILTGTCIKKPGKMMFETLNRELYNNNNNNERRELILNTLDTAFHRFVQTSRERKPGFIVQDKEGAFSLEMEDIRPCKEKKGLRCLGLRSYDDALWNNYQMNLEYDYKTNTISVYDKEWQKVIGGLQWDETEGNIAEIKNLRRCINTYYASR